MRLYHKIEIVTVILTLSVNDLVIATNSHEVYIKLKQNLAAKFQTTDLGLLRYCLGIEFKQDTSRIILWQRN